MNGSIRVMMPQLEGNNEEGIISQDITGLMIMLSVVVKGSAKRGFFVVYS